MLALECAARARAGLERLVERIAVIGAGAWGTALAQHLCVHQGRLTRISLWARRSAFAEALAATRHNPLLPGVRLDSRVLVTDRLEDALAESDAVIVAVPSHTVRGVLERAAQCWPRDAILVSAAKGIESGSLATLSEVAEEVLQRRLSRAFVVLSGPSFAREVALGQPTNVVAASKDEAQAERVQQTLSVGRLRVYTSSDPMGVQVAAALKNVIAIAVGASDGLGLGHNARAALITRGLSEIARLAVAKGGQAATVSGLAGLGDLVLTCTGELSRNRTVGMELGRGRPLADVLASLGHVAEGVTTARCAEALALALGVDIPICSQVCQVLFAGKSPEAAVDDLLRRPLKKE